VPRRQPVPAPGPAAAPATALRLFLVFTRIGLTSFGGGLSGWLLREFVQARGWMSEEEFLDGLALSQALPGVNVTNMAIWIGYRLRGTAGATAALAGIIVPPGLFIVALASVMTLLARYPATHLALDGAAAAAIGLSLAMGLTTARRVPRRARPLAFMVATFLAVGPLRLPLVWVVLVAGGASVALEYARAAR
jgi:chromate transporter